MTLAQCVEIEFTPQNAKSFYIYKINNVSIESSWKTITDTAEIVLPRNVSDFDKNKIKEVFRRGDKVRISLGYNGNLKEEFTGYISQVSAEIPIKIKLEDEMYRLKKIPVNFASKGTSVKAFISQFVKDYPIDCDADIQLGAVRYSKTTLGEVLDKFQKDMSLYSFIRDGKLTIAKPYSDAGKTHKFDLERNCVDNSLNYVSKEDRLVKIIGKSIFGKGEKLEFEWGDNDAKETINWTFSFREKKELENAVKKMYNDRKKDGLDGNFTTFGIDSIKHGEKVELSSSLYPDREGTYYTDAVKREFGKGGYRQTIDLGQKAY